MKKILMTIIFCTAFAFAGNFLKPDESTVEDSPDTVYVVKDVEYVVTPKCLKGFMCFPAAVSRNKYTRAEIEEFLTDRDKIYWQKHSVWDYEEESRVVLSSGISWLAGERLSLSPYHT